MILNIDFLIMNFKGTLEYNKQPFNLPDDCKPFSLVLHEYGNKVFKDVYDLFYCDEKVGILNACPRSNVIDAELVQFQLENHLFYQNTLSELNKMVSDFVNYFALHFYGINRLDICVDSFQPQCTYLNLYTDLIKGDKLLKGREKNICAYSVTKKGKGDFDGFTVGKRSSARFLRIYDKTKALLNDDGKKNYISDWHTKNGLISSPEANIWRFEYQLNNRFFADKKQEGENITWQIFDYNKLVELFNFARSNHFEPVHNTGKAETNKEIAFEFLDFTQLEKTPFRFITKIARKPFALSLTVNKRLVKGLFRQYYNTPCLHFLYPILTILREFNLIDWFKTKYDFYVREFQDKEKIRGYFNEPYFLKTFNAFQNI